jgi:hypothetical protein
MILDTTGGTPIIAATLTDEVSCAFCPEEASHTCDICEKPFCAQHGTAKGGVATTCQGPHS